MARGVIAHMERTQSTQRAVRHKKRKKRDILSRFGTVTSWDLSVFVYSEKRSATAERQALISLVLKGTLVEPVRNTTAFGLTVFPCADPELGNAEIPSVGSIIAMKPVLNAVVQLAYEEFQVVMALATAGRLVSVRLSFQEPRYGSALIASCSFSSQPPEEE